MKDWVVRQSGENAVLIELGSVMSEEVTDRVQAVADHIHGHVPEAMDVIPGYTTVLVMVRPGSEDQPWDQVTADALSAGPRMPGSSRHITIPVLYGGEYGPDLLEVASQRHMDGADVVAVHSQQDYRIHCLGFSPGFPFLGELDPSIQCPRRSSPRRMVPAGSVGIAERQTGIYAVASPGGWQIIGRTPLRLFRPEATPPIVYQPRDRIRFQPIDEPTYQAILEDETVQTGNWPEWIWTGGLK